MIPHHSYGGTGFYVSEELSYDYDEIIISLHRPSTVVFPTGQFCCKVYYYYYYYYNYEHQTLCIDVGEL